MKIKKIFLVCLILLAILSVGAVSANGDIASADDLSIQSDDALSAVDEWDDSDDWYDDSEDEDDDDWEVDEDEIIIEVNEELGPVYYMDDAVIASLTLPSDAYGNLSVFEGDYDTGDYLAGVELVNGFAQVSISDLNFAEDEFIGDHILTFVYEGDDYAVTDGEMVLSIVDYEFTGPKSVALGESATFILNLHRNISGTLYVTPSRFDGEGDYIDGEVIYFDVINGVSKAVFSNLNMGMYTYRFEFSDDDYLFDQEASLDVYPKINVKDKITIGKDNVLSVDLPKDAQGSFLLSIYSEALDDYIDFDIAYKNGNIVIPSIGLASGNYDITGFEINDAKYGYVNFEESSSFNDGEGIYASFKAVNPTNSAVIASNFNTVYTANGIYKVKVTIGSKPAAGARVVFKINNVEVKSTFVDKNGYASLKITKAPGNYKITTIALGKTVTKILTVKHLVTLKKVTVKRSAKSLVIQASLAKVNGKYLKNKWISFKFPGISTKVKTNSKGVAILTIPSKVLGKLKSGKKITYQATYLKDTVKVGVTVKR